MALASMAGRAMAGTGGPGRRERIGATTREPTAPPQSSAGGPITSIAAELRELASLGDSGILTAEEFSEQKRRLLPHRPQPKLSALVIALNLLQRSMITDLP
jgi:putative oligomerization/nucleic acid binding protein